MHLARIIPTVIGLYDRWLQFMIQWSKINTLHIHIWFSGKSPVYSHVNNTLAGHTVIRAFHKQTQFMEQFHDLQDKHTSAWNMFICISRWMTLYLSFVFTGYILILLLVAFITTHSGLPIKDFYTMPCNCLYLPTSVFELLTIYVSLPTFPCCVAYTTYEYF